MQATARMASVVSSTTLARRRLIRDVTPTTHTMSQSAEERPGILPFIIGLPILAVVLYVLTAPPLMIAMTRHNPREWPRIYQPLAYGFQCDWTQPLFSWYFDTVWVADTEIRGE
jgi:hypothetical protein